jgi:hypothetical protein
VGYAGQNCEPACVPPCQHGGRCVAPGECECVGPYAGALCEEHVCTPACAAHGVCAASNRCTCARGYQGDRCSLKCVHGVAYFGTCQCVPGWVGRACDRALCRQTCVHGACVEPNRCACDDGWAGFDCTAATTAAARGQRNTGRLGAAGAAAADELPLTAPNAELLLRSKEQVASLQGDINRIKQRKAWQELEALEAELAKLQKLQRSVPSADTGRVTRGATGGGGGAGGEMRDARSTSRTRDDGRHSSERRPTKESLEAELAKYQVFQHPCARGVLGDDAGVARGSFQFGLPAWKGGRGGGVPSGCGGRDVTVDSCEWGRAGHSGAAGAAAAARRRSY